MGDMSDYRAAELAIRRSVALGDRPGDRYEDRVQDAFLQQAAIPMREQGLGRIISLTAQKVALLALFDWTDPITHSPLYWGPWLAATLLGWIGVGLLALRRGPPMNAPALATLIVFVASMVFAYSISGVFTRYRMHIEAFAFVFVAVAAWRLPKMMDQPKILRDATV
jgi:hypothetical protein